MCIRDSRCRLMRTHRLFYPHPEDKPLPPGAVFLDDTRTLLGFPSYQELHPEYFPAEYGASGSGGMNPGWNEPGQHTKVMGILGEYDPRRRVREFGSKMPYDEGYAVRRDHEPEHTMRRFEVDDDFTHGNSSQRLYNHNFITSLNNRPTHFDVPCRNYAKPALVRNPHRKQDKGLDYGERCQQKKRTEENQELIQRAKDAEWGNNALPILWDIQSCGLPAHRNATHPALNELDLNYFDTHNFLTPPDHQQKVIGNDEAPIPRFEQGAGGLYALGPQFVVDAQPLTKAAGPDPNLGDRLKLRSELLALQQEHDHLVRVKEGLHLHEEERQHNDGRPAANKRRSAPASAEELGLSQNHDFGKRVYQCMVDKTGVGYRRTPQFPDKTNDGFGPCWPECIIANDICQGPQATFVRCASGCGWLPLHTPTGSDHKVLFRHLGRVEEVNFDKDGLVLADQRNKLASN
eukprot:TRINITY_DN60020_c0_g1_i1.p1 TRINITY_DN60020_c0_g1~~TRINITY_DN60020_c0_g1_i1.p1  ORF type:complete len:461 (-),score=88.44 TRINITY_DN60020_c0_g1_i1:179-1561(-)